MSASRDSGGVDRVLDHEYDGIREFDNRLPNWWLFILYASIVFALGYWLVLHTVKVQPLQEARYAAEMAAAAERQLARLGDGGTTNESLLLMSQVPARVGEGEALFRQYCVVCHAAQGQGLVGPNLTDGYWLHGGAPVDIHRVVTDGVPAKGMAAWGNQLGPARVQAVVAYVLTLRGSEVPGKEPQGEQLGPRPEENAVAAPSDSALAAAAPTGGARP